MKEPNQVWNQYIRLRLGKLNFALVAIVLLGLALRLWGINFGLPYTYAPDEPSHLLVTLQIVKTGDLNPHWWYYPSLMFYLNAAALGLFFLAGRLAGAFTTLADLPPPHVVAMGVGRLDLPGELLVSRGLVALFSAAAIVLVYLIGRRLHANKWVAAVAALLFAVSPTVVDHSHRFGPDIFALFFSLASFLFAVQIVDEPKLGRYLAAGVAAGLAIASKYNAGVILIPFIVAHFLRFGFSGWRRKELYLGLAATGLAFVAAVPFAVLDFPRFWEGVRWQIFSYSTEGHAGQEGNAWQWYVSYLLGTEGGMVALAALCGAYSLFAHSNKLLILISFPLVYLLFVSQLLVRNARTSMLIIPFLDLLAAVLIVNVHEWMIGTQRFRRAVVAAVVAAVGALVIVPPMQTALADNIRLTQPDGRETARQWLEANLPAGARVAEEAYAPYLDAKRFVVQGFDALADHPPAWYVQNGFEYLIFSQGMYKRFFDESERYGNWVTKYNQFFALLPLIARFDTNGYEVRVYRTGVALPAQRVAARFGDAGDLIELVGYDPDASKWLPGEPLRVKLSWRALRPANEPLELDLRLLGPGERAVGAARADLFQGKYPGERWPEGIFDSEWLIPTRADAEPGLYSLVANVAQTRYGYRVPIQTWAGEKIETLLLGPFKLSAPPPSSGELQSMRAANVRFGDQIALLGYVPPASHARAGDVLSLTCYWQALVKPARAYTVFIHLLDAEGRVRAQSDVQPRGGAYPSSLWDAGEIIRDDYTLPLPADLALGVYRIEIGLYEYPSLTRLEALDPSGRVLGNHWFLPDLVQLGNQQN